MIYSDYKFTLDVQINQSQVSVPVQFGDTARKLCISLTDGRKPYVIAEGCRAVFNAKKPDGNTIKNDCIIERNTILYEFTSNTTNAEGVVRCDITLYDTDGKVLTSPQFIIVVDKKVVRDEEIPLSESESTTLDRIIASEQIRQDTFSENEAVRQETFELKEAERQREYLGGVWVEKSKNLYNPELQTSETISTCYCNEAGETTVTSYNCTAPIEIKPSTQYTLGLVPSLAHLQYGDIVKPWHQAAIGVLFYDENDTCLGKTAEQTFTSPENTKYIRFNYLLVSEAVYGKTLDIINERCVIVEGKALPTEYIPYGDTDLKEGLKKLLDVDLVTKTMPPIYYHIVDDNIYVVSKYGNNKDLVVRLNKHGGNNIFDFAYLYTIDNTSPVPSNDIESAKSIIGFGTDIHAPFWVEVKNNPDGDGTAKNYTGGNHAYDGVASGRTASIRFFINGKEVSEGSGYCSFVEIRWTNYVQAINTFKADGTGRECLVENHCLIFDGVTWSDSVELIPLEDIRMAVWYGLQIYGTNSIYPKIKYIGGKNRLECVAADATECGNATANGFIVYGDEHTCKVMIDDRVDLGARPYFTTGTNAIHSTTAGKVYFYIIRNADMNAKESYYLQGSYRFSPR